MTSLLSLTGITPSGDYYIFPDGSIHHAEDTTPDELILDGYSDDYIRTPLPHDESGYPFIPEEFLCV